MKKSNKELTKLMAKYGFVFLCKNKHMTWIRADGMKYYSSCTSSDTYVLKQIERDLRKL
jgi:hypothetical protein